MKRNDAERLLISIGIAAGLFGAAGLTLSFIDIPAGEMPPYQGPVFITIEEEPPVLQEPPEEAPEEPAPAPAPSPAPAAEPLPAEKPAERPKPLREPEEPPPAETEAAGRTESRRSSSSGTEAAADTSAPAPEEAEEPAAAGTDTGAAETEPLPEGDSEEDVSPREGPETAEAEERSVLGDLSELDTLLSESGTAGRDGPGTGDDEQAAAEDVTQLGTESDPIDFETLAGTRKPISLPQPEIDPALARNMPRFFTVVISFTLLPSGYITDLNITPDSGNTKVDSIIQTAIRKWRFEPVSEDAGPIQVRVRYNIRVR